MLISSLWYKQTHQIPIFPDLFCEKWFHVKNVLHFFGGIFRALCNPVRCIFQFSVQFSSSDKWVLLSVGKKKLKLELCLGSLSLLIIYFHENFWTGPGRSGSTQKKSGPSQNWCVFPRKKRKKNSFEKKASKDFLHITPTSIMYISKLFCYKNVHFMY